jgi:tetratricopeptide (TPR) repeat protein
VEILLEANRTRRVLLLVSLAATSIIAFQAAELWVADRRIESQQLETMEKGAALMPGNADAWDRLGRYRQWSFADPDPSEAIADYLKAIGMNPLSANYWMDLASADEASGDDMQAREAYLRAKSVYPVSAQVEWNYGNFLLRQGEFGEGYAEIQKAVREDSTLVPLAISRTWRSSRDANTLLDKVLPPDVGAYSQALDFFESIHEADPGIAVWERMLSFGKPVTLSRSFKFFEELIREERGSDARRVWLQALAAAGLPHDEPTNHSLVWDGDFTQDFANGGLGWRWDSPLGVAIDFDSAPPSIGGRSVRLDFGGGSNLLLSSPSEYVPVEPHQAYHFRGSIRTDGITTESGMRFSIVDPHHPNELNLLTDNLTGRTLWMIADAEVTTGADTHFVVVRLYRNPSRLFDNRLSGTVWIAGISLVPSNAVAEHAAK